MKRFKARSFVPHAGPASGPSPSWIADDSFNKKPESLPAGWRMARWAGTGLGPWLCKWPYGLAWGCDVACPAKPWRTHATA